MSLLFLPDIRNVSVASKEKTSVEENEFTYAKENVEFELENAREM